MFKGIVFALSACFIWGFIFVVPLFMGGFTSVEISLGRYFFFGIISSLIFLKTYLQGSCRYPFKIWCKALLFSLASTIGYYTFFIVGLRFASPAICALILSISPITIAFYGNWMERECSFKSLILPSVLIVIGLIAINVPHLAKVESISTHLLGMACSFWALLAWSWYVVANARFLRDNPKVSSSDWSTLIGVVTLFWVFSLGLIASVFFSDQIEIEKYLTMSPMLMSFLMGSAVLGLMCSWLGSYLWNISSHYLPVSLAGQLTIFETIFGLCFVYLLELRFPPALECLGIGLFLTAVYFGIRSSKHSHEAESIPSD